MTRQSAFAFAARPRERPTRIVTDSTEAFLAVCRRAEAGEIEILSVAVGDTLAEWVIEIAYE